MVSTLQSGLYRLRSEWMRETRGGVSVFIVETLFSLFWRRMSRKSEAVGQKAKSRSKVRDERAEKEEPGWRDSGFESFLKTKEASRVSEAEDTSRGGRPAKAKRVRREEKENETNLSLPVLTVRLVDIRDQLPVAKEVETQKSEVKKVTSPKAKKSAEKGSMTSSFIRVKPFNLEKVQSKPASDEDKERKKSPSKVFDFQESDEEDELQVRIKETAKKPLRLHDSDDDDDFVEKRKPASPEEKPQKQEVKEKKRVSTPGLSKTDMKKALSESRSKTSESIYDFSSGEVSDSDFEPRLFSTPKKRMKRKSGLKRCRKQDSSSIWDKAIKKNVSCLHFSSAYSMSVSSYSRS